MQEKTFIYVGILLIWIKVLLSEADKENIEIEFFPFLIYYRLLRFPLSLPLPSFLFLSLLSTGLGK